jgi:hypothetical protein
MSICTSAVAKATAYSKAVSLWAWGTASAMNNPASATANTASRAAGPVMSRTLDWMVVPTQAQ